MTRATALIPVLLLSLLAGGCGLLGGDGTYEVRAEFSRTYNLFPGSPVRVLGVTVGKIKDLEIEAGADTVTAVMVIDEGIRIPADARATVIPEALLGERYIQFSPPYTSGPVLEPGGLIPDERTAIPAEFDEVLASLNDFVGGLDEEEVGRLFANLADVLEGQGEQLGLTLEQAQQALAVLADNDEELIALAGRLSDLNETLATRDEAIGEIIEDWNTVAGTLVDNRGDIDAALEGLVRITRELGRVLQLHGGDLREDLETLTRVGRTANRNLDNLALTILGGAELFRHAERVFEREQHAWLPLLDHKGEIAAFIAEDLADRLEGLCLRDEDIPDEVCTQIPFEDLIGGQVCVPPLLLCPEDGSMPTLTESVRAVVRAEPRFGEAVLDPEGDGDAVDDGDDDVTRTIIDEANRIAEENARRPEEVAP